jgi:hypothetical protein
MRIKINKLKIINIIMETIEKIDVRKMKSDIKIKVEEQRMYKMYRKCYLTIDGKLVVPKESERKISRSEAQWKHRANRHTLRIMYAAYGLARGKSFQQIENAHKEEPHPLEQYQEQIDKILDKYKIMVQVEVQE